MPCLCFNLIRGLVDRLLIAVPVDNTVRAAAMHTPCPKTLDVSLAQDIVVVECAHPRECSPVMSSLNLNLVHGIELVSDWSMDGSVREGAKLGVSDGDRAGCIRH